MNIFHSYALDKCGIFLTHSVSMPDMCCSVFAMHSSAQVMITDCRMLSVNSSTLKRTLRRNNRDLARALELKKAELSSAQSQLMKLRAENQSQMHELIQLRTSTNMQSIADVEQEVKRRVEVSTSCIIMSALIVCMGVPINVQKWQCTPATAVLKITVNYIL